MFYVQWMSSISNRCFLSDINICECVCVFVKKSLLVINSIKKNQLNTVHVSLWKMKLFCLICFWFDIFCLELKSRWAEQEILEMKLFVKGPRDGKLWRMERSDLFFVLNWKIDFSYYFNKKISICRFFFHVFKVCKFYSSFILLFFFVRLIK